MSTFKYADESIQSHDIMIAVPSMVIAVGIFYSPVTLAEYTKFADGWLAIIMGGVIAISFTWLVAKLASKFPNRSFLSYSSSLVSKPIAYILTFLFILQGIMVTAFEISTISSISQQYLFEKTPFEVIAITFLLVVIYAVSGSRVNIFRLNVLFLPIVFFITGILILFSIGFMEAENLLPIFTTDLDGYLKGAMNSSLSYSGVGILFFYISLVKKPKKVASHAALGMSSAIGMYLFIYLTCIAVFGQAGTEVIRLPLIELAKSIEVPGGFFERIESVFFVIWITAVFTTTMMAFDVTVMALQSIFQNVKKTTIIFSLSPVTFFVSMMPNNFLELIKFGEIMAYASWGLPGVVVVTLWIIYGIKGAKGRGK